MRPMELLRICLSEAGRTDLLKRVVWFDTAGAAFFIVDGWRPTEADYAVLRRADQLVQRQLGQLATG